MKEREYQLHHQGDDPEMTREYEFTFDGQGYGNGTGSNHGGDGGFRDRRPEAVREELSEYVGGRLVDLAAQGQAIVRDNYGGMDHM